MSGVRILGKIAILNRGFREVLTIESFLNQNLVAQTYAWEGPHRHDMAFGPESAVAGVVGAERGRFELQFQIRV